MRTKSVLIMTDSVALPRKESTGSVRFEETWPYLLRATIDKKYWVQQVSLGRATSADLFHQAHYYYLLYPDIVIIQAGIVDCAPRTLTKKEKEIVSRNFILKILSQIFIKPLSRLLRQKRNINYVSIEAFKCNLVGIKDKFKSSKIFCFTIPNTSSDYNKIVPGVTKNIQKYNLAIREVFENVIDLENFPSNYVMKDFHHLSKKGHSHVYELLTKKIKFDSR